MNYKNKIDISDHAIIRYLQRVYKLDIDGIKRQIMPLEKENTIKRVGDGAYTVKDDVGKYKLIVKGRVVVTILEKGCTPF